MQTTVRSEEAPAYVDRPSAVSPDDVPHFVRQATDWLESRLRADAIEFSGPPKVADYLRLKLAHLDHEVFAVAFLDSQHRLIAFEPMFRGTLTQTSVYPREVVKRALANNAAAVILAHNRPSGVCEPSRADEALTQTLKNALALLDVRVLDHFVVSAGGHVSFAERGLI